VRLLFISLVSFGLLAGDVDALNEIRARFESPQPNSQLNLDLIVLERMVTTQSPQAPQAAALLAVHSRRAAKPRKNIFETLRGFAVKADGSTNTANPECCFEYARLLAKTDLIGALRIVNEFGASGSEEQKVFAGECAGDIMLESGDEVAALQHYTFAEKYGKAVEYARESNAAQLALKRVQAALMKLRRKQDTAKYGEEFVLYREAENARKWGNHAHALSLYDDLIKRFGETVFARAAEVYGGYCLVKLNRVPEAEKRWLKVAEGEPWAVYRGEALVALGELFLFQKLNFKEGSEFFMQAQEWVDSIEKAPVPMDPFKPPERSGEVTRSPENVIKQDQFGNIFHVVPNDGALVNHLTAPWYLDDLRMRIAANYGFVLMVEGKVEEAKEQFGRYRKLDEVGAEQEKWSMGSFASRMEWNLKNNKGCLRAYPEEAAAFTDPKRRLLMFMADLAYEKEDWGTAKERYERLLRGEFGKISPAEEAYLTCALAQCESRFENDARVMELVNKFEKNWQNTPSWPRGMMLLADYLSGGRRDEERCMRAVKVYETIAQRCREPYAEEATYKIVLTLWYSQEKATQEAGRRRAKYYRQRYPNGYYKEDTSDDMLEWLGGLRDGTIRPPFDEPKEETKAEAKTKVEKE